MNHYGTPKINSVIEYIAGLSRDLDGTKKPDFSKTLEKSGLVPLRGMNPNRGLKSFKIY
jgi:hypothetical protein